MSVRILHGDCLVKMPELIASGERFHACVTDPPYHLQSIHKRFAAKGGNETSERYAVGAYGRHATGFMGKQWDGGDIAFRPETWRLVWDLLLPGAHLLAFGGTRGWHRQACAIEDAGFEIRDTIAWVYGSGFPKSHNLDGEWTGWGTALKPAFEPIIVARKPLIGTVAENVLQHGCGAMNIDASRIPTGDSLGGGGEKAGTAGKFTNDGWRRPWMDDPVASEVFAAKVRANVARSEALGRWPANVIHDGSDEVVAVFPDAPGQLRDVTGREQSHVTKHCYGEFERGGSGHAARLDSGSAARFFYTAKADAAARAGSKHPTVKPTDLMRYLVRLVTPPSGRVLDPFAGTGSTLLAADQLGFDSVGIEADETYAADARRKIAADAGMFADVSAGNVTQEAAK